MNELYKKYRAFTELCRVNNFFLEIPFAGTAAFLACDTIPDPRRLLCVFVAVIAGYISGNVFNDVMDIKIDKTNPRTQKRPLADGRLTVTESVLIMLISAVVVVIATGFINIWYIFLLPVPLGLALFYSITKRFTWFCHFVLGITIASIPVGSWIVFRGWNDWRAVLFGAIVFFWTVGFELIYSSQDAAYDNKLGMKSIPAVFGIHKAYMLSRFCHIVMAVLLLILMYVTKTGWIFFLGYLIAMLFIVKEHMLIKNDNVDSAGKTFALNHIFSMILFITAILDRTIC